MKRTIYACALVLIIVWGLVACTKDIRDTTLLVPDYQNLAKVQVYNATLNTQRNFVYLDGNPLNGSPLVYTQTTATNAIFSGSGQIYGIAAGLHNFTIRDTSSAAVQPQLVFGNNLQGDAYYTIFTYDSMNAIKQVTVRNNIVVPSDSTARVRFANFVYSKNLPSAVDLFSKKRNETIFSNIALAQVTEFIPYASNTTDSLIVRAAGTLNALDTATLNPVAKRSYTLVFRGRLSTNEAGGALFPRTLASFVNY